MKHEEQSILLERSSFFFCISHIYSFIMLSLLLFTVYIRLFWTDVLTFTLAGREIIHRRAHVYIGSLMS